MFVNFRKNKMDIFLRTRSARLKIRMMDDFSRNIACHTADIGNITSDDIKIHTFEETLETIKNTDTTNYLDELKTINMIRELFENSSLNDAPNGDEYVYTLCSMLSTDNQPDLIEFGVLCSLEILCSDSCKLTLEASEIIIPTSLQLIETSEPLYVSCGLLLLFTVGRRSSEQAEHVLQEMPIEHICNYIFKSENEKIQTNAMRLLAAISKWDDILISNQDLVTIIETAKVVILNSLEEIKKGNFLLEEIEWGLKLLISISHYESWFELCRFHRIIELIQEKLFAVRRSHVRCNSIICLSLLFCKRGETSTELFNIDFVMQNMTHHIETIRNASINFIINGLESVNGKVALVEFYEHGIVKIILKLIQDGTYNDKLAMLKILQKFIDCLNDPMLYGDGDSMEDVALDAILQFYDECGIQQIVSLLENSDPQTACECFNVFVTTIEKLHQRGLEMPILEFFSDAGGADALSNLVDLDSGVDQEAVELILSMIDELQ